MGSDLILYLVGPAIITAALVAGVFLTFSDFGMRSLGAVNGSGGIEAMQLINRNVYGSLFLVLLMGVAALSLVIGLYAYAEVEGPAQSWLLGGAGSYLGGVFLVTVICNVPMNKQLDRFDPSADEASAYWRTYLRRWTFWNHVRTAASAASAICFLIAALLLVRA